jgi:hypothetical protein
MSKMKGVHEQMRHLTTAVGSLGTSGKSRGKRKDVIENTITAPELVRLEWA